MSVASGEPAQTRRRRDREAGPLHVPRAASRALPVDIVAAKIRIPQLRPGTVSRTALVNRLRTAMSTPVMTVTAPAGYGKTTLLAQWAARDSRPFAWVSIDERD